LANLRFWNPIVLDILRERDFGMNTNTSSTCVQTVCIETIRRRWAGFQSDYQTHTDAMSWDGPLSFQGALLTGNWGGRTTFCWGRGSSDRAHGPTKSSDTNFQRRQRGGGSAAQSSIATWSASNDFCHSGACGSRQCLNFQPQSFRTDDLPPTIALKTAL